MADLIERITVNPDLCNGKPTIRGKRITVQTFSNIWQLGTAGKPFWINFPHWKMLT